MLCLGIETSCDETAAAVVGDGTRLLSNVVASQVELHRRYGGVFPELASRRHIEAMLPVLGEAMRMAGAGWEDLGLIAVTRGPGLVGSLLVGLAAAKALAFALDVPLVGVNHILGHIYANLLDPVLRDPARGEGPGGSVFPAVCLVVSGGHTDLVYMQGHGRLNLLGRTRDDAAGEAFDKVARLLGLPYPGGPALERLARQGDPEAVPFPRAMMDDGSYDFSFSGLKTAVAVYLEREGGAARAADVAASFQKAVVDVLVAKTVRAALQRGVRRILLAGGVAANSALRESLRREAGRHGLEVRVPPPALCTDNAAMIACAGYFLWREGGADGLDLDAVPRLGLAGALGREQ